MISRTSTQKYKSAPDNMRGSRHTVGVANLLEGSVQKIANGIHVNVQLIRAATDEHLWAESYNRKLDDVFAVEGEVASAIAEQLNAKLTGAEQKAVAEKPTQNLVAYDAYLRGAAIEHSRYSYDAYQNASREYAEAVRWIQTSASPGPVWPSSAVFSFSMRSTWTQTRLQPSRKRRNAPWRSLRKQANHGWRRGPIITASCETSKERSAPTNERSPGCRTARSSFENLAFVLRRLGRWDEAEAQFKKALELDPRDVTLLSSLGGEFYNYLRRFGDARAVLERAIEISPDADAVQGNLDGRFSK